jgi:LexA-binding, inner membrane-associated putative hydrolase
MFLGHVGLAFAAKRVAPKTSLGTLLLAMNFADCFWPIFLILGLESVRIVPGITKMTPLDFTYPWSHSLLMDVIWAMGFAAIYFALRRYPAGALVIAAGVLSHWVLDWISHRPDMPLTPWSQHRYGLGLWNSVAGTVMAELALFVGGLWLYLADTRRKDRIGSYALSAFGGLILVLWIGAVFGPPPPSAKVLQWSALSIWLTIPWAYWIDRHRERRNRQNASRVVSRIANADGIE